MEGTRQMMGQKASLGCAIPRFVWFLLLILIALVQPSWSITSNGGGSLAHQFDTLYNGNVTEGQEIQYVFQVRDGMNKSVAVRVEVSSSEAQETYPVMFVVTQQEGIMSWKLPFEIISVHKYDTVARTLCPMNFGEKPVNDVVIRVTCASPNATDYSLIVTVVNDFEMELSTRHTVMASPSQPQYYYFKFPEAVEAVQVRGHSNDKICATISVQEATCPVFDLLRNVEFIGKYQTLTTQSSIIVQKRDFQEFFIVLVVHPGDTKCSELKQGLSLGDEDLPNFGYEVDRIKNVTINIIKTASGYTYWFSTTLIVLFYMIFYVIYGLILLIQCCRRNEEATEARERRQQGKADSLEIREGGGTLIAQSHPCLWLIWRRILMKSNLQSTSCIGGTSFL
ncbi:SID1 transmembrane family member 1-like [Ptychodera flava]|uniref:SID1 transmembrane family member 1-like n=1 Tax=Ptychodera flava TaxID=63121 RepID=UPI003969F1EC